MTTFGVVVADRVGTWVPPVLHQGTQRGNYQPLRQGFLLGCEIDRVI